MATSQLTGALVRDLYLFSLQVYGRTRNDLCRSYIVIFPFAGFLFVISPAFSCPLELTRLQFDLTLHTEIKKWLVHPHIEFPVG